ncbi:hypothetical protein [Bacteroides fragilis]|uniref:hypothetical protein n=1 Tax=Bacteroides fragilis TaxID=817 RepID=UPI0005B2F377
MEGNRLKITMESRIHGDVYVRFGGERLETYRPKGRQGALHLACGIDLRITACRLFQIVGQAVDRGLHRNRRHLHNGWLRRSRNGKMTQRKEYRQGE